MGRAPWAGGPKDAEPRDSELRSFSGYARHDPERAALIDPEGETLSYGELSRRVNRLSNAIAAAVPRPGATVAMLLTNGPDALITERAVTQLPLYLTPVNWHLTTPEIAYILADSGAALLVTTAELQVTALAAASPAGLAADRVIVTGGAATGGAGPGSAATGGARSMADFTSPTHA
jgi:long-chain acyl-CoA synthetase